MVSKYPPHLPPPIGPLIPTLEAFNVEHFAFHTTSNWSIWLEHLLNHVLIRIIIRLQQ